MSEVWYSISDIIFNQDQVIWIIKNLELLEDGKWPEFYSKDYRMATIREKKTLARKIRGIGGSGALYTKPIEIGAEVKKRLKRTKKYGKQLVKEVHSIDFERYGWLTDDAKTSLYYCRGWWRKKQKFSQWRQDVVRGRIQFKKYREKKYCMELCQET